MARKKSRTAAQRRATAKLVAFNKARRKKPARRKATTKRKPVKRRRKRATVKRKPARRKKTVATRRRTARRRPARRKRTVRRRSTSRTRRNPPRRFSAKGIVKEVQQGVIDAFGVVVGKAATRIVANFVPIPKQGAMMNFVVQAGSAIVVGMGARMVVSRDVARMVIAGGFAAPVEGFAKGIPFIGPMLGDDYLELGEYAMGDADPFLPIGDADPFLPIGEEYDDPYSDVGEYAEGVGEYAYG